MQLLDWLPSLMSACSTLIKHDGLAVASDVGLGTPVQLYRRVPQSLALVLAFVRLELLHLEA